MTHTLLSSILCLTYVLFSTPFYCLVLHFTVQYSILLFSTPFYCSVLHFTVQYSILLFNTPFYCSVLHFTVQYSILLFNTPFYCQYSILLSVLHFTVSTPFYCQYSIYNTVAIQSSWKLPTISKKNLQRIEYYQENGIKSEKLTTRKIGHKLSPWHFILFRGLSSKFQDEPTNVITASPQACWPVFTSSTGSDGCVDLACHLTLTWRLRRHWNVNRFLCISVRGYGRNEDVKVDGSVRDEPWGYFPVTSVQ